MISVMMIWLYMLVTCYLAGFGCVRLILLKTGYTLKQETGYLYAGIGAVTVYAQLFSIFYKVGLLANLFLLLMCVLIAAVYRKELAAKLYTLRLTITPGKAFFVVFLFLLSAYGASRGMIHYDTGLYHAQSIRWIEEYGVVPGLGNLHSRLAYNSAAFCLSALYSMAFLGGQSFHCCAGFLAFLLAVVCFEAVRKGRERKLLLSDIARIMGLYYLLNIYDEMISPASDYFMVLLVFFIVIRWLELTERREASYAPYALLSLLSVVVVSMKLSGAFLLLLVLKPAVMMLKEKCGGQIAKFLVLGVLVIAPFLVRNVILSGWLVYPFTAVDLFDFDFKIPKGMADYDSKEIQVFGRGYTDVTRYEEPFSMWFPNWFESLSATDSLFLILAVSGIFIFLAFLIYALLFKKKDMVDSLHVMGTFIVCFLFWLFSAPLIRYGCVFLWLSAVLPWGYLYGRLSPHTDRFRLAALVLLGISVYKLAAFGTEVGENASADHLIWQKDYENFETESYELHGYTFYYPKQGDRTGYQDFPAAPLKAGDIFRGSSIRDGFKNA